MEYGIKAVEYVVPNNIVSNEYIINKYSISDDSLAKVFEVEERRWADENVGFSELAITCGRKIIENYNIDPKEIDVLIVATSSDDFYNPKSGAYIQQELKTNAFVLNINQSCAGPVYGLKVAESLLKAVCGRNALILTGDKDMDKIENHSKFAGGDACSAVVLSKLKPNKKGIISSFFNSDGSNYFDFGLYNYGSKKINDSSVSKEFYHQKEGNYELLFKVIKWFKLCYRKCLEEANLDDEDISFILPHPAAISQIKLQLKSINRTIDDTVTVTDKFGHSGSGTLFITIKEAIDRGALNYNDKYFMFANGSGFVNGGLIVNYNDPDDFE